MGALGFFDAILLPNEYVEACKASGVRLLKPPRAPVKSVALDYLPLAAAEVRRRYEFGSSGRIERVGTLVWQPRVEQQADLFEVRTKYGPDRPEWQFYRYRRQDTPDFAAAISAEVLVVDTVSHSEELTNALWKQGMVQHHLKVTDLRNGDELAEMSYVVDLSNRRGCGINAREAIDVDVFILQATRIPIMIPEYERQRREHATVKNW